MRKSKMGTKLSVTYAVLLIVMIGISSVVFYKYNEETIHTEGVTNLSQMTTSTMEQIDSCLNNMEQVTIDVLADGEFTKQWETYTEKGDQELFKELKRKLIAAYKNKTDIRRVAVYDAQGIYVCTGMPEVSRDAVKERVEYVESTYILNQVNSRVFMGVSLDFWEPSTGSEVITEIKPVKNREKEIVGYIEIQQNSMYIKNICDLIWGNSKVNTLVYMGDSDDLFYQDVSWDHKLQKAKYFKGMTEQYVAVQETSSDIISQASSNYYACRTVLVLPKVVLYKSLNKILQGIIFVAAALILFTVFYSVFMTGRIMKPIKQFIKKMQNTELDNFVEHQTTRGMDWETQILMNSFEEMANRLQNSILAQRKMEEVQTKTLFSILQSEISPHFLYNTLGSIANLCERGENLEAADACYSLTEIMRYASNYATSEVTLLEEITKLKAYMALMKSRYRQRLEYEIQMDPALEHVILPKLTLQPLVENAIKYSLMETDCVLIKIYAVKFDGDMILEVKDNGCGFTQEAMEKIKCKIEEFKSDKGAKEITENIQFGGMGLSGTLIRLSIFFEIGFHYELINCNDEGGTSIVLHMKIDE